MYKPTNLNVISYQKIANESAKRRSKNNRLMSRMHRRSPLTRGSSDVTAPGSGHDGPVYTGLTVNSE